MTSNQISYAAHLENVRHNLVGENQGQQSIDEGKRHNKEQEAIGYINASAAQSQAASAAFNAQTNYSKYTESVRHNQTQEEIEAGKFNVSGMGFGYAGNMANYKYVAQGYSKPQTVYKSLYGPDFYESINRGKTVTAPNMNAVNGPDYYSATSKN